MKSGCVHTNKGKVSFKRASPYIDLHLSYVAEWNFTFVTWAILTEKFRERLF